MPSIDYMKVLDIAALTLETSSHIEIQALDLKLFTAVLLRDDGTVIEIFMRVGDYDLELTLSKKILNKKEFGKWLSKFEYQLEQNFFKNISFELSQTAKEHKIKIIF